MLNLGNTELQGPWRFALGENNNGLGVFSYADSVFSYAPGWWVLGFMLVLFSVMRKCLVLYSSLFSMCLVLYRQCFFLCGLSPTCTKHQHTFHAHTMENVIGRICKLCTCTRPGDPGTTGIDPMVFPCHDMVLKVPLKRCVVLDVAASLKLKRSPAQSTSMFFMLTLTLSMQCKEYGGVLVRWSGGVVAWWRGAVV